MLYGQILYANILGLAVSSCLLVLCMTIYLYDKGLYFDTVTSESTTITTPESPLIRLGPTVVSERSSPVLTETKLRASNQAPEQTQLPTSTICSHELDTIVQTGQTISLTDRVLYYRRRIAPVFSDQVDRDVVANSTVSLLEQGIELDLSNCSEARLADLEPISLTVPRPYPGHDFSHIIFGVATDTDRLRQSRDSFAFWLSHTGAQLITVITDGGRRNPQDMRDLEEEFASIGINATFFEPIDEGFTASQNHFAILLDMIEYSTADTTWFALLDDDTFFPSLYPLSEALATLDHTKDTYVGALSEDFAAVKAFGFMAFGGAGIYLSASLARKLGDHVLDCIYDGTSLEGDVLIRDCVYKNSKAKLTALSGLYQQDMRGDVSGFFESGLRPLNLHHWKTWYKEPVVDMAAAAKFCGECFLQRWTFGHDTVLANGFSIAIYQDGLDTVDLDLLEGTWWSGADSDYDFSIGPLRKPLSSRKKKSYKLKTATVTGSELRQFYVWRDLTDTRDEVVELIWNSA
ncbi:glycosyltransferase family 31 protein [Xylariaceae sp. FL1272]|nr:glycosyltransferase family 31 protein [Xylariaceae sp. FL1272]